MTKGEFEIGSSKVEDFFAWINERHQIYVNRFEKKMPKPWTDDPIFQQWKFTNVFRQLDTGTIALHDALQCESDYRMEDIAFTIIWYRLFNWHEHIKNLGITIASEYGYEKVEKYILKRHEKGEKIFTSAHMTRGFLCEDKHITYLRAVKDALNKSWEIADCCIQDNLMEKAFKKLLNVYMIGDFTAYEIVCDFRFTKLLQEAKDRLTWANIGPGAKRGLRRLGMDESVQSIIDLYNLAFKYAKYRIKIHLSNAQQYPPFELREIEHSLCEFDKYERIRLGEGRPKQKYKGV